MKDIQFQFSTEEVNLILESLGNQPFIRVYGLIAKIQEQANRQIPQPNGKPAENPSTQLETNGIS